MHKMSRDLKLEKQIDAYIKGKLTEEEAQNLWKKLLQHPEYIELLETELGIKAILEQRSTYKDHSRSEESGILYSLKKSSKWVAAAAAVIMLGVAITLLRVDSNQTISELALKNINLAENLSSAEILRSQKTSITPADSLLNRGFEAALSGNVSAAVRMYNQIIDQYSKQPAAIKAYLNKGIIQYNGEQFGKSIAAFKAVLSNIEDQPFTEEKAYWYLGNAYINTEQMDKAKEAVYKTYEIDGIYRKPAFRLLKKLDYEFDNMEQ